MHKGRVRGTKRCTYKGQRFDSVRERNHFILLEDRQRKGEITNLERQVKFPLHGRDGPILTPTGRQMVYIADFTYVDWTLSGAKMVVDAKGWATDVYKLKKAILAAQGVEITEV